VQCLLGETRLHRPWLIAVQQASAEPFIAAVRKLWELDSQSDEKCPCTEEATKRYGTLGYWTITDLPPEEDGRRFKMCHHHYEAYIKDSWIQSEFSPLPAHEKGDGSCDYGNHPGARIALLFAKRNRTPKSFHDWAALCIETGPCIGLAGMGQPRFVLSEFSDFVACRTCFRLSLAAVPLSKSLFRETNPGKRERCVLADRSRVGMWAFGLVEAEWKSKPEEFVETARKVLQTPPCPLLGDEGKMALQREWHSFRSDNVDDMIITVCEACFLQLVLPSGLATSFNVQQPPDRKIAGCDFAHPAIRAAFEASEKEKRGSEKIFEQNLLRLLEGGGNGGQPSSSVDPSAAQPPEIDISRCHGPPEQIAALQQLQREVVELRRVVEMETARGRADIRQAAFEESNAATMKAGWGISGNPYGGGYDGHGSYYDTHQEANAGALHRRGMQRLAVAQSRSAELAVKTEALLKMKEGLMRR
jgi:hypothetical protein